MYETSEEETTMENHEPSIGVHISFVHLFIYLSLKLSHHLSHCCFPIAFEIIKSIESVERN